jgi:hypothetical protein
MRVVSYRERVVAFWVWDIGRNVPTSVSDDSRDLTEFLQTEVEGGIFEAHYVGRFPVSEVEGLEVAVGLFDPFWLFV